MSASLQIRALSDLHLEHGAFEPSPVGCDLVVLAGDIHTGTRGVLWATQVFPQLPVLYVPGNHEYYGGAMPRLTQKLRDAAAGTNVTILQDDAFVFRGVHFLGATLWTDFELLGDSWRAMAAATRKMTDYHRIRISPRYAKLLPTHTRARHYHSRLWLEAEASSRIGPKVVITHHAPSIESLPVSSISDELSPAYASELHDLIVRIDAVAWIHGHIHHPSDYLVGRTRVRCNPRGYAPHDLVAGFDGGATIEVQSNNH